MRAIAALLVALAVPAFAPPARGADRAGDFDYYVLALSWSPTWCALTGDARRAGQCDSRHDFSFTLHGLWPQYEAGWPSDCATAHAAPSRAETRAMEDIMGSAGLAWHEWRKHGRCSGLGPADYFALSRQAYERISIPEVLARLDRDIRLPAAVVEAAFLDANPGLTAPMITITCDQGRIAEARICLTRDLDFRPCGIDVSRDCRMPNALMDAVR